MPRELHRRSLLDLILTIMVSSLKIYGVAVMDAVHNQVGLRWNIVFIVTSCNFFL